MKNTYIAVTIKENDRFYSYGVKVNASDNVLSKLKIKNIVYANICESKKQCENMVKFWNDGYKKNNQYLY